MYHSKSPQRDEESLLLNRLEFVLRDALTKQSEMAKEGDRYGSRLTRSKISIHSLTSLHSKLNMKVLPSLSTKISAKIRTALPSSVVLVTSFHNRA